MPNDDPLREYRAGPKSVKLGLLFRTRKKIAQQIVKIAELMDPPDFYWDPKKEPLAPDPLVLVCRELKPTPFGKRLGLYYCEKTIPRFSNLMTDKKFDKNLEEGLWSARDTYSEVPNGTGEGWIHGFVFEANGQFFVYHDYGVEDYGSVLVVRQARKERFIHCLGGFLAATNVAHEPDHSST